ncbi:thioesterase superfamily protein [Roseivivax marinus]|uniref:Thioesterase superfamily protein n=1 Tax=Roseivivax marinus TaxID=1379903 RepID=W4HGS3_9RHOB|nr:thioesterase family protein [Roseivivax marinus]ETW11874.1 thioesterase superfamily protein [Roseivivax marinus]UMA63948.1 acyl-CoA thioesterase [Roseivivax marinus]
MSAFTHRIPVLFQHCDPAGIVFYPRYFEMLNATIETFFAEAIGWSFSEMHVHQRVGVPLGRIETDFHAASRLGDVLDWTLQVDRVGGASLAMTVRASCDGEARLTARPTLVLVDLDRMTALRWPDDRRAALERHQGGQTP